MSFAIVSSSVGRYAVVRERQLDCDVNQDLRHALIVGGGPCRYLGKTLAGTRIHLCGRLTADIAGSRIEDDLPGRQGKLLFAYLVVNRLRPATRPELIDALWVDDLPGNRSRRPRCWLRSSATS